MIVTKLVSDFLLFEMLVERADSQDVVSFERPFAVSFVVYLAGLVKDVGDERPLCKIII